MLNIVDIRAGYGDREILHGVTARFDTGVNYCILGPNGCGKTTLVRAIAGLIQSTGTVELDGRPLTGMKRRDVASRIAVMNQMTSVYFPYTVYDTVMLGRYRSLRGSFWGRVSSQDKAIVDDCLDAVGLQPLKDRRIDELSGGQRQMVFLAQALAQDPEIILLDEPTNHLDIRHQIELIDYLQRWTGDGRHSVIGVMHDINLALRLTDNIMLMLSGNIVAQGRFSDIANAQTLSEVYGVDIVDFMRDSFKKWSDIK